jgi:hypothetical protein
LSYVIADCLRGLASDWNEPGLFPLLEMSAEDLVQISAEQFDQYVLDNWRWRRFAYETNQWLAQEAASVNVHSAVPTFLNEESDRWGT